MVRTNRREWMRGAAGLAMVGVAPKAIAAGSSTLPDKAEPLPLSAIRLRPSIYATAVETNRRYLYRLSADRLLHNFRVYAGLEAKAPIYGGWESDTIAGHTLGHYMSALVLTWQQTGDTEMRRRADYIVGELAEAQAKRGTGYVGALGRKRADGKVVDGEEIFPEIMAGKIKSGGFDLNGSWSPLYTVHKLFAGLLDIHGGWGNAQALDVAVRLGGYFARVFAALDDAQMQTVLGCEYGGLNESFAELYQRTGDRQWLTLAERIYDRKVLDPLVAGEDKLANFHANTQVPKLIGLARLHEITGKPEPAKGAAFFWETVTGHHSYVIGGNADREYFSAPDTIARHVTDQTCEHCNTYNMMKLTRHLYGWKPDGRLFDYYERAHLNHVMAAQHPENGGFTYMTPLMSGAARSFSTPQDDAFWCCVGSGMEAHAKHGESIFWQGGETLFVNLYIPSEARWEKRGALVTLDTAYPMDGASTVTFAHLARPGRFPVALRVPGWANGNAVVEVNGQAIAPVMERGYAVVDRRWKAGDTLVIRLPLDLRTEAAPGDDTVVAVLRGPMVMAADLGPAATPWDAPDPAMVGANPVAAFTPMQGGAIRYAVGDAFRPKGLGFVPFFAQYERRSAVYFKRFTEAGWKAEEVSYLAEQAKARDIAARSVDVMYLGEMQPERDHALTSDISYPVSYLGKQGRDARSGGYFEFTMAVRPGPLILQATYWGEERARDFDILVDNVKIATQHLENDKPGKFFTVEYALPEPLMKGKKSVRIRVVPHDRSTAGPIFGMRLFTAKKDPVA